MLRSLRKRLILSHILPSLLIIPLMGVAMLYLVETRVLLPVIYSNLADNARLMAEVTRPFPEIWQNASAAQVFVDGSSPYLGGQIALLDTAGHLLASSNPADAGLFGQQVELPALPAGQGEIVRLQNGPQAEVFAPVQDSRGKLLGIVRMSTQLLTVSQAIYQMRYLLGGVLLLGVAAGVLLGSTLGVGISRPLQRVTRAIQALTGGDWNTRLPEDGPEEMRTLARAVNSLVERLHSMEQSRRQLLANMVHELGRPLGALRSASQALLKGAGQDAELEHDLLLGMDGETRRLQRLLDDLAGMYDQILGNLELDRQPIDVNIWLPGVLLPWAAAASEKSIAWQTRIPNDFPPLEADSDRLAQALGNLCSNAIKFTPAGGQITISAGIDQQQLWVQISDSGPGIHPDDGEKIFQPFYRGVRGKRVIQGMGLGLTIARDILQAHGGTINYENLPERGTAFRIRLPVSNKNS